MARQVSSPDGRRWTVARRWTKRRVRWRGWRRGGEGDGPWRFDIPGPVGELAELHPVLAIVVLAMFSLGFLFLMVSFVLPAVLALVEGIVLILFLAAALVSRVLLRRPWEVEAHTEEPPPERRSWGVIGWKASGRAVDEVAQRIEAGVPDPAPVDAAR